MPLRGMLLHAFDSSGSAALHPRLFTYCRYAAPASRPHTITEMRPEAPAAPSAARSTANSPTKVDAKPHSSARLLNAGLLASPICPVLSWQTSFFLIDS